MRPVRLLTASFAALFAVLLAACDKASEPRFGGEGEIHSIAHLKSLCDRNKSTVIRHDISVRGRVTGNDRYGEFYKTLVIEDATGGITVAADHDALADDYPFGSTVTVHCNGLTLYDYGGKIQLGTTPGAEGIGRIPRGDLTRHLHPEPSGETAPRPTPLTFPQIGLRHADTYVRFDGVRFAEGGNWCDRDLETHRHLATEHRIVDTEGNSFLVRTAGSCIYADEPVPSGTGSLCGVIDYFNGKFSLRVTAYETAFVNAATPPRAYP